MAYDATCKVGSTRPKSQVMYIKIETHVQPGRDATIQSKMAQKKCAPGLSCNRFAQRSHSNAPASLKSVSETKFNSPPNPNAVPRRRYCLGWGPMKRDPRAVGITSADVGCRPQAFGVSPWDTSGRDPLSPNRARPRQAVDRPHSAMLAQHSNFLRIAAHQSGWRLGRRGI